jgi:CelD/BcsL family acetyltransferase involved in cellulose biosynthesis
LKIEKLRPELAEEYDRFLLSRPETLFYCYSRYKDFLKDLLGCEEDYLLAVEGQDIRGTLPLMYLEREGKRVYNSLPFYGSNGGIVGSDAQARQELRAAYTAIARAETTASATVINSPFADAEDLTLPHNLLDSRIGQFTRIAFSSEHREQIMAAIDSSARRNVSKAAREGVTVGIDHSQLDRLREMHQANIAAIGGIPKTERFFNLIPKHFAPGRDFDLYVAKKEGLVIAGLLLFYFNKTVEYITPAIDADYRTFQPLSLILIEAMTDASKRGFAWWNWGGTWNTQMGVYRFKKKWGAVERHYNYYIQLNDASILEWPQGKILETFPNFYVTPFSALKTEKKEYGG